MSITEFISALKKYPRTDTARFYDKINKKYVYIDGIEFTNNTLMIVFDRDECYHSLNYDTMIRYFEQVLDRLDKTNLPLIRFRQFGDILVEYEVLS